eukprot:scaffold43644_cov62-Cyclotella_meneghiniana.AAC.1
MENDMGEPRGRQHGLGAWGASGMTANDARHAGDIQRRVIIDGLGTWRGGGSMELRWSYRWSKKQTSSQKEFCVEAILAIAGMIQLPITIVSVVG